MYADRCAHDDFNLIRMLSDEDIQHFMSTGYVRLENVFDGETAFEGRTILWKDTGCHPEDPSTWTRPVIRLGGYAHEPFQCAANMPVLHQAFDQLVGKGRWQKLGGLGTFPVRFPGAEDPGDTGWHAEASFYGADGSMRLNVRSKGRALLLLFLFSDVGINDAPTRILEGSHMDVPPLLESAGEAGLSFMELGQRFEAATLQRPTAHATGKAGTVFLCHPFLVHAAQAHRGNTPRFMAQPPLLPRKDIELHRDDGEYSPVEQAIRIALDHNDRDIPSSRPRSSASPRKRPIAE